MSSHLRVHNCIVRHLELVTQRANLKRMKCAGERVRGSNGPCISYNEEEAKPAVKRRRLDSKGHHSCGFWGWYDVFLVNL